MEKNKLKSKELLRKNRILQQAAKVLKSEFVGIDKVIDEIIASVSAWYLFPGMQEKPVVVCLWGLTGVGKSSVINRLSELIHFSGKHYCFDMSDAESRTWSLKKMIEEVNRDENGLPIMLTLDEFQHARTLSEVGFELSNINTRIIWQLLDSGRFQISRETHRRNDVFDLIMQLKYVVANGVRVENGLVIKGRATYLQYVDMEYDRYNAALNQKLFEEEDLFFVPQYTYGFIFGLAKELFHPSYSVQEKLEGFNAEETIDFLTRVYNYASSPKWIDCSKSIIFVIGNLDEAYRMSNDFNTDINADEFHEKSLKITLPLIKNVLKNRFRNEQIARLGNNHIIYPAFNKKHFQQIIALELKKIARNIRKQEQLTMTFDNSLHELIYNEGVYPAQGTRPVFSTINQVVKDKLGLMLSQIYLNDIQATRVRFSYDQGKIRLTFFKNSEILHILSVPQELTLSGLRENTKDDKQAIVAVHEAGHAVLAIVLLRTIPQMVFSRTANEEQNGFTYTKISKNYLSRQDILNRLALHYGGYLAEKLVFGIENMTISAETDIYQATAFINSMLKENGMGSLLLAVNAPSPHSREYYNDTENRIEKETRKWVDDAISLAEKTLKEQELLLLKIADVLSEQSSISKDQLLNLVKKYAHQFSTNLLIDDASDLFYRRHLKQKVKGIPATTSISHAGFELQLNSKTNKFNQSNE